LQELTTLLRQDQQPASRELVAAVLYRACSVAWATQRKGQGIGHLQHLLNQSLSQLQHQGPSIDPGTLGSVLVSCGVLLGHLSRSSSPTIAADVALPVPNSSSSSSTSSSSIGQAPTAAARSLLQLPASRGLDQLLGAVGPELQLQQLVEAAAPRLHLATAPQLCHISYGLATLSLHPSPAVSLQLVKATFAALVVEVSASTSQGAATLSSKQAALLLWSLIKLGVDLPAAWLDAWWAAAQQLLPTFNIQDVSNTIWALATAGLPPPRGMAQRLQLHLAGLLEQQQRQTRQRISPHSISNILWGLAKLQEVPQGCAGGVEPHHQQQQQQQQQVALLAKLLLQQAVGQAYAFDRQQLANTVWAVAKLASSSSSSGSSNRDTAGGDWATCRHLVHSCLQGSQHLLVNLQPVDWSNIMWGLGTLRVPVPPTWLQQLYSQRPGQTPAQRWTPAALCSVAVGAARLGLQPPKAWWQAWEAASASVLTGGLTSCGHQEAVNMVWALGVLRHQPTLRWWGEFWVAAAGIPVAAAAGGGDSMDTVSSGSWLEQQQQQEEEVELRHVGLVLQAAARLQYVPPRSWLQAATAAITAATSSSRDCDRDDRSSSSGSSSSSSSSSSVSCSLTPQVIAMAADGLWQLYALMGQEATQHTSASTTAAAAQQQQQLRHQVGAALLRCQQWLLQRLPRLSLAEALLLLEHLTQPGGTLQQTQQGVFGSSGGPGGKRGLSPLQQLVAGHCWLHLSTGTFKQANQLLELLVAAYGDQPQQQQQQQQEEEEEGGAGSVLAADKQRRRFWAQQAAAAAAAQEHRRQQVAIAAEAAGMPDMPDQREAAPSGHQLLEVLQQQVLAQAHHMSPKQLSQCLQLVCRVKPAGYTMSPAVLGACAAAVAQSAEECSPQVLARQLYCLGQLGYRLQPQGSSTSGATSTSTSSGSSSSEGAMWLEHVSTITWRHMPHCGSSSSSGSSLVYMLVGLCQVAGNQLHNSWLQGWCEESLPHLQTYTMAQLAAIAAALQQAHHSPDARWLLEYSRACWRYIAGSTPHPRQLEAACALLVNAGVDPGQTWCRAVADAMAAQASRLTLQQLGVLAVCLAHWGYKVPRDQRLRCLHHVQRCRLPSAGGEEVQQCLGRLAAAGWRVHQGWLQAAGVLLPAPVE
jgi:hypothetical protein